MLPRRSLGCGLFRYLRHILHCILMFIVIFLFLKSSSQYTDNVVITDPFAEYGVIFTLFLYFSRILPVLVLPQSLSNLFGLTLYNTFPAKVKLKVAAHNAPFLCIRVVTRGDYPELVKANIEKNLAICQQLRMDNYVVEVVTDKAIFSGDPSDELVVAKLDERSGHDEKASLVANEDVAIDVDNTSEAVESKGQRPKGGRAFNPRVKQTVVPRDYVSSTGAMFKSRALQYALEDGVNKLSDNDYILHLDEETLLTRDALRGVLNFCSAGKHSFGQGMITYGNDSIVNWITTLADSYRVADDLGKLRFTFRYFHKPWFSWKGSYVCTRVGSERTVSFDHGPDGSIAEDCYFSMVAFAKGFTFDFIEGALWEKSPFTVKDLIQQRKRWLQGIYLVVHSPQIPWKNKFFLAMSLYAWATLPLSTSNLVLAPLFPLPLPTWFNVMCAFIGALNMYMYIFGVLKTFSIKRAGVFKFFACVLLVIVTIPLNLVVENIAVAWGLIGKKHKFYIVDKNIKVHKTAILPY